MYALVVIDDEKKIAEGIANLFPWESLGFQVVGAFSDSQKAFEYIKQHHVDVLLTDIEMPILSGLNLAKKLSGTTDIQVVLFSSHQNYDYFRDAIHFKVCDYLLKPIKYEALAACFGKIKESLDKKRGLSPKISRPNDQKIVEKVNHYIEHHYKTATLDECALLVNLSANYLSKFYKEKRQVGFSEMLLRTRMKKACELLEDPSFKHYEIAYHVGYDNPKNFSRAFKHYFGITPSEYREGKEPCLKND